MLPTTSASAPTPAPHGCPSQRWTTMAMRRRRGPPQWRRNRNRPHGPTLAAQQHQLLPPPAVVAGHRARAPQRAAPTTTERQTTPRKSRKKQPHRAFLLHLGGRTGFGLVLVLPPVHCAAAAADKTLRCCQFLHASCAGLTRRVAAAAERNCAAKTLLAAAAPATVGVDSPRPSCLPEPSHVSERGRPAAVAGCL